MNVDGITFHFENIQSRLPLEKIQRQSKKRLSKISPQRNLRLNVIQKGREFEGIAWGAVSSAPVNAYCRSNSIHKVVQSLESQIKSQYRRRRKQQLKRRWDDFSAFPPMAMSS